MLRLLKPFIGPVAIFVGQWALGRWVLDVSPLMTGTLLGLAGFWLVLAVFSHKKLLQRYLAEYEFRYNGRRLSDGERTVAAIQAADGKRLRYREPVENAGVTKPKQLEPNLR